LARPPAAINIPPNKRGFYLCVPKDLPIAESSNGFRVTFATCENENGEGPLSHFALSKAHTMISRI